MKTRKVGATVMIIVSSLLVGLLILTQILGYRFFVVTSPSMGETAPVGSLVVVKKSNSNYKREDIVTFYNGVRVYTHRVVDIHADGYITKGDLNKVTDAMVLKYENIIGRVVYIGKYLGWLWRALPFLIIGFLVVYFISCTKFIDNQWRWPTRIVGCSIVVVLVTFFLNPWLRIDLLNYVPSDKSGVSLEVVNTGVFPINDEQGGRFFAGQTRVVHTNEIDNQGRYVYVPRPSLGSVGMVLALLWCLTPLIIALIVKLPPPRPQSKESLEREKRVNMLIFSLAILASLLFLLVQLSSLASLTVQIENTLNEAKSNKYFTCSASQGSNANPAPLFAYAVRHPNNSEIDISGHNQNGYYPRNRSPKMVAYPTISCVRDNYNMIASFYESQSGSGKSCLINSNRYTNPQTFSLEAWFRTTKRPNGTIIGFGSNDGYISDDRKKDRHIYLNSSGNLMFGVYNGQERIITGSGDYADGNWHHVVATLSSAGMKLYADGELVAQNPNITLAQNFSGYWKIGCGTLKSPWQAGGTDYYFSGAIQHVAVYGSALTPEQVKEHYLSGR